jgi:hypothetical protein
MATVPISTEARTRANILLSIFIVRLIEKSLIRLSNFH